MINRVLLKYLIASIFLWGHIVVYFIDVVQWLKYSMYVIHDHVTNYIVSRIGNDTATKEGTFFLLL